LIQHILYIENKSLVSKFDTTNPLNQNKLELQIMMFHILVILILKQF